MLRLLVVCIIFSAITRMAWSEDNNHLTGKWNLTEREKGGKKAKVSGVTFEFATDKMTITDANPGRKKETGTYKIDPTKTPATMDIDVGPNGPSGQATLGIYKLENDRLVICFVFGPDGKEKRPTAFESKPDSSTVIMSLEKLKN